MVNRDPWRPTHQDLGPPSAAWQTRNSLRVAARMVTDADLLTPREAAEMLRIKESTLRDYARRDLVPSIKIGRHLRFVKADIRAYVESLRRK